MTIVSAFLVPGSPLPLLDSAVPGWGRLAAAVRRAGRSLAASQPDVILLYSTQWFAVLDQLWLVRPQSTGLHVDENWHEYGDMPFDIHVDVEYAHACVEGSRAIGIHAKGVDYDGFPIDSGTITACTLLEVGTAQRPVVIGSNNLYHDGDATERLAAMAASRADELGRRVAVVGVGGLSGSVFRDEIDTRNDRIHSSEDDRWNRRILRLMESGDVHELRSVMPEFCTQARADMGLKHLHWVLGALGGRFHGARVHDYNAVYGAGAAVVEFTL